MRKAGISIVFAALIILVSCVKDETADEILQKTIETIDTVESIYYKQDMMRSNPRNASDTLVRYREMYFKRLIQDSIVGVQGHWYFYNHERTQVSYEDIYDGDRLVRKNNPDSLARLYDLEKYPAFRNKHFWSHNTLYAMQYEFKYMLEHTEFYVIERLNDTMIRNKDCYQIHVRLAGFTTMPGFATVLEKSDGSIFTTLYFINKENYYPIRMYGLNYSEDEPAQKFFIDQRYYDIKFNLEIDDNTRFNTSLDSFNEYKIKEIKP